MQHIFSFASQKLLVLRATDEEGLLGWTLTEYFVILACDLWVDQTLEVLLVVQD